MNTALRVIGVVLNVLLAGLGFIVAPKGKKTRGIFWFGIWFLGSILVPVVFSMGREATTLTGTYWAVVINVLSAVDFFRLTKRTLPS